MVGINAVTQIIGVRANGSNWAIGRFDNSDTYRILMVNTNNYTINTNITGTFEIEVFYI